ncbi:MAG: sigma-54 dependent transcriptional regulator, partial [Anaerovorax sp.]
IQKEEIKTLRNEILNQEGFVSRSKSMDEVKKKIARVAPLDMTVLVNGETGVGKEVTVKAIHRFSSRKDKPFIKINCGMIPENLMESEFFGYEDGAFTGASKNGKIGTVELANGGTLFLDEIGEMPLSLQVKLLEFLQDKTITRVGGVKKIAVDARIIVATNRDLEDLCKKNLFRQDLYYRLNIFQILIPSLREREDDILPIAEYYLSQYSNKYGIKKTLSDDIKTAFLSYGWPGNIRELEHVLECLYVTVDGSLIEAADFNRLVNNKKEENYASKIYCTEIMPLKEAKWEVEKQLIRKAYEVVGSTYKVAELLSIDQSTVVKLMKKHQVTK